MKNLIKVGLCTLLAVLFLSFQTTEAKAYSADINYNIADDINNANVIDTANGADVQLYDFLKINGATFATYDGSLLKGDYDATFIGYRAAHTNIFYDKNSYDKNDPATFFSTGTGHPAYASDAGDTLTINAASTYFFDVTDEKPNPKLGETDKSLQYYILKEDWTYTGTVGTTLSFLSGDIIVGFNDDGSHTDHLDLVVALRPSSNVPIPGAIWLLGSGLLGLVGIRRRNS